MKTINRIGFHSGVKARGILLLCAFFWITSAQAQFIQQMRLNPAQPVDNQPVQVIADLFFPNSGCPVDSLSLLQTSANRFDAYAMHCVGLLTVICNTSDTFNLGVLPAGSYRFVLREVYGWFPSPCTAGTQPPAIDSIDFQVTVSSGMTEHLPQHVRLYPNPSHDGMFTLQLNSSQPGGVARIFDIGGRQLQTFRVDSPLRQIDLSAFSNGIYLLEIKLGTERPTRLKLVKQ